MAKTINVYQDVSDRQYGLVNILSEYHKNLFVVGDPDQNIYSWRGSNMEFLLDFDKCHNDTKTIILDQNYRSTNNILKASNSLIEKNTERIKKDLFSENKEDIPVVYNHLNNTLDEAKYIVEEIKNIKNKQNCKYSDFAILYRAHYVSRNIEEILLKENIPYEIYSGISFYQRAEIKDVISYLRMIVYQDDISFLRTINIPKRGFGDKRIKFLKEYSEINGCSLYQSLLYNIENPFIGLDSIITYVNLIEKYSGIYKNYYISDLLDEILKESGYEENLRTLGEDDRLDNLSELKNSIFDLENNSGDDIDLETYLQDISLYTNSEKKEKKDSIKLLTIHTAKGLEWDNVFICQLNEYVFPSLKTIQEMSMEEERRVCYVAMTRARKRLFLTSADGYTFNGEEKTPSRFIGDIDKKLIKFLNPIKIEQNILKTKLDNSKTKILNIGDTIIHKVFGTGHIEDIDYITRCYIIKFEKFNTNRKISFSINLEKL